MECLSTRSIEHISICNESGSPWTASCPEPSTWPYVLSTSIVPRFERAAAAAATERGGLPACIERDAKASNLGTRAQCCGALRLAAKGQVLIAADSGGRYLPATPFRNLMAPNRIAPQATTYVPPPPAADP
jgi:hypothetical protein